LAEPERTVNKSDYNQFYLAPRPHNIHKPLGIALVGLYMLFGACLMPVNMYAHAPAFLMSFTLSGWTAGAFFAAICLLDAAIGINLLSMTPWSRTAAIWFFAFRIANTAATVVVPGSRLRFEQSVWLTSGRLASAPGSSHIWFGVAIEICIMVLALWFLATNKAAFLPAGSPPGGKDSEPV
jgi:hypothetical protein